MTMKTGRKIVVSVEILCPYCGETLPAVEWGGSLHWDVNCFAAGEVKTCNDCGKQFKMPKR